MRKRLPMTALITGLLAAPALAGASALVRGGEIAGPGAAPLVETFPAEMPVEVGVRLRRWAKGEKLSALGMQAMQGSMARAACERVARAIDDMQRKSLNQPMVLVQMDDARMALDPANAGRGAREQSIKMTLVAVKSVTFLGVQLVPVTDAMADQLHLPRGMGMLVEMVSPDSPAEKGGLKANDLLQKMDDQLLVNDGQIQTLVHAKAPGDVVTFALLRGGSPMQVKVTLGEKQVVIDNAPTASAPGAGPGATTVTRTFSSSSMTANADGSMTRTYTDDRGNIALTRNKEGKTTLAVKDPQGKTLYEGDPEGAAQSLPADLAKKVAEMANQPVEVRIQAAGAPAAPGTIATRTVTLDRNDQVHDIALSQDAAGRHLTITELATRKTIYDGPLANPDDLLAQGVPQAVVEKVKLMLEKVK